MRETVLQDRLMASKPSSDVLGISENTFWRDVKAGKLPKPYYVTPRAPRWRLSELLEIINQLPREAQKATNCAGHEGRRHKRAAS